MFLLLAACLLVTTASLLVFARFGCIGRDAVRLARVFRVGAAWLASAAAALASQAAVQSEVAVVATQGVALVLSLVVATWFAVQAHAVYRLGRSQLIDSLGWYAAAKARAARHDQRARRYDRAVVAHLRLARDCAVREDRLAANA